MELKYALPVPTHPQLIETKYSRLKPKVSLDLVQVGGILTKVIGLGCCYENISGMIMNQEHSKQ